MPAKKMVNLSVEETSGVDHPAHMAEGWIILKQADRDGVAAAISALAAETTDNVEGSMPENDTPETDAPEIDLAGDLAKAQERIAELEALIAASVQPEAPAEDSEEALIKSAPAAVREMLEKARGEAEAARAELAKAREMERDREFITKAKGWAHLSLDAETFGPMLRRIFDLDPQVAEVIDKALEGANAQAESGHIFDEIGKPAAVSETSGDTLGRVQSMAKAAVEAGEYPTIEQAVAGLVTKNPDLYSAYLAERNG